MHSENENTNTVYFKTQLLPTERKKKNMKVEEIVKTFCLLLVK